MRGRSPTPTSLKVLRGNPGNRPLNKNEAQPKKRIPAPPKFLDKIAKKEYRRMAKILLSIGLMTEVDGTALAAYASAFSLWYQAWEEIKINGLMLTGQKNGHLYQSPYVGMANKAQNEMITILKEFGMTPSARSRVVAAGGKGTKMRKNPYDEWKNGGAEEAAQRA